ncbi:hypothetical protein PR202_ga21185 [Eleusine coracana subsp. coracana]|uniref:Uncharacterized protein n=1 Tax=Eleusine coracana subsp. coracana TaxID=191504 RepID=A0AAV5CZR1_ELECO|nr:hypothetical protein PR202_ga21185 [Eleusine coracana subsp. coracana]
MPDSGDAHRGGGWSVSSSTLQAGDDLGTDEAHRGSSTSAAVRLHRRERGRPGWGLLGEATLDKDPQQIIKSTLTNCRPPSIDSAGASRLRPWRELGGRGGGLARVAPWAGELARYLEREWAAVRHLGRVPAPAGSRLAACAGRGRRIINGNILEGLPYPFVNLKSLFLRTSLTLMSSVSSVFYLLRHTPVLEVLDFEVICNRPTAVRS